MSKNEKENSNAEQLVNNGRVVRSPFDITIFWPESEADLEYYEQTCKSTGHKLGGPFWQRLKGWKTNTKRISQNKI
jgi:hypothetical protein